MCSSTLNLSMKFIRGLREKWKAWYTYLKMEVFVLMLLFKHPEIPKVAKALVFFLLSYIFSPIDLIPDPIPIIGHWDDILLIPIVFWLIKRNTPKELIDGIRAEVNDGKRPNIFSGTGPKIAAVSIIILWIAMSYIIWHLLDLQTLLGLN